MGSLLTLWAIWKCLEIFVWLNENFGTKEVLLSHISRVRLCATPSLGFSRQEHWSGLPFPSPMHKSEKWKWSYSVMSDSSRPHGLQPTRLLRPWDFPGKSNGVGCHCLFRRRFYWHLNSRETPLNILQCTCQPPQWSTILCKNVSSAKVEKPWNEHIHMCTKYSTFKGTILTSTLKRISTRYKLQAKKRLAPGCNI